MAAVEHHQLALRHQPVVLAGGDGRHQRVALAVDDEHRHLEPPEDAAQRPLVGVVEVARVGHVEGKPVEAAEVGRRLVQRPEAGQLDGVDAAVQQVVAQQLELLDADRGQQDQRAHPPRAAAPPSPAPRRRPC